MSYFGFWWVGFTNSYQNETIYKHLAYIRRPKCAAAERLWFVCSQWQSSHTVLRGCVHVCNVVFLACFAVTTETVGVPWPINKEAYVLSWVIVVAYVWVGGMFVEAVSGCVRSVNCGCMLLGSKGGCGHLNLVQMQPGVWKMQSLKWSKYFIESWKSEREGVIERCVFVWTENRQRMSRVYWNMEMES